MGVLGVFLGRGELSWSALFFSAYNAISRGNDEAIIVSFQYAPFLHLILLLRPAKQPSSLEQLAPSSSSAPSKW